MTREEHLKWCKERAISEFDYHQKKGGFQDAVRNGITSMMSDISKHSEISSPALGMLCLMHMMPGKINSRQEFVNFINGFN